MIFSVCKRFTWIVYEGIQLPARCLLQELDTCETTGKSSNWSYCQGYLPRFTANKWRCRKYFISVHFNVFFINWILVLRLASSYRKRLLRSGWNVVNIWHYTLERMTFMTTRGAITDLFCPFAVIYIRCLSVKRLWLQTQITYYQ